MPTQMKWMKISLIYNESIQHTTTCDSYDAELAAKPISTVKLENDAQIYSVVSTMNYDLTEVDDKQIMYKKFVAFNCDGCPSAPLTQYKNSDIYADLIKYSNMTNTLPQKVTKKYTLTSEEVKVTQMN